MSEKTASQIMMESVELDRVCKNLALTAIENSYHDDSIAAAIAGVIKPVAESSIKLTADIKLLREALSELIDTSMSNERQLSESMLEKFRPSSDLVSAMQTLAATNPDKE